MFTNETFSSILKEAKENPRYSQESEAVNFFYALSQEYQDEETGDASEWVRHAVLFRFKKIEALWLLRKNLINRETYDSLPLKHRENTQQDTSLSLGFSIDDCGNPSVVSEEEYRSIEEAYHIALSEQEQEELEEEAEGAFVLALDDNGKASYTHAGKAVFISIEQDENAENPLKRWDGAGSIYSLNRRHDNYDRDAIEDALQNNPDAVPLSYFEHSSCVWGLAEDLKKMPGVEFTFDGVEFAGVWIPDASCLEELKKLEGQRRKDEARKMAKQACEVYTQYCNGEIYQYCVDIYNVKFFDGEPSAEKEDYRRDEPVLRDSCGEFFGRDHLEEQVKEVVVEFFKELEN